MEEENKFEALLQAMNTVLEQATEGFMEIIQSEPVQTALDVGEQVADGLSTISNVVGLFKAVQKIWNIPTNLYLKKLEQYCKGVSEIPIEKRKKYIELAGSEKINRDNVFVLNMVNRVEETEKIPFFVALWASKVNQIINDSEYRRLMILVDHTLYSDLLYLKEHITADPIRPKAESEYGLISSGLLVSAGLGMAEMGEAGELNVTLDVGNMLFN